MTHNGLTVTICYCNDCSAISLDGYLEGLRQRFSSVAESLKNRSARDSVGVGGALIYEHIGYVDAVV